MTDLAGGRRAEGDGELAVRVGEDLAARRIDREDRVVEGERVLLDEPARRAELALRHAVGLLVEAHEGVEAVGLVLARGAVRLPREAHFDVRPVVQLERRLRQQRDVARLEHEQRALEPDLDVARGAGEARVAALARVVLDEQLLGVLAARLRLEAERQLQRLARLERAVRRRDRKGRRHRQHEAAVGVARVAEQEGLGGVGADGLQAEVDAVGELEARARPARRDHHHELLPLGEADELARVVLRRARVKVIL